MTHYVTRTGLEVDSQLAQFIEKDALPHTPYDADTFWTLLHDCVAEFSEQNRSLLQRREELQASINAYHQSQGVLNPAHYRQFLERIGYIEPEVAPKTLALGAVAEEIANVQAPQLVVPLSNARFAINAANARFGSLYDALYGSDVIDERGGKVKSGPYNEVRGLAVIDQAKIHLDVCAPLVSGQHAHVVNYHIEDEGCVVTLKDGQQTTFTKEVSLVGYTGEREAPLSIIVKHHGLHVIFEFDKSKSPAKRDLAGLSDIKLEAAVTTIMDCEDSVAAVDGEDKALVYANWLGLVRGSLSAKVAKAGREFERTLADDLPYTNLEGEVRHLKARSLLFVRNVGHLMTTPAVKYQGDDVFEGLLDACVTVLCALAKPDGRSRFLNDDTGNINIVKPKMHGSDEVAFTCRVFGFIENRLGLKANRIKVGIMDEERRTSINLANCISAAHERVVFINTGFLDRTGDEIHTSMLAGATQLKNDIKGAKWLTAYEAQNVALGLKAGFAQSAQIGKGMWPKPDELNEMMIQKRAHVTSGASTAWVPSPTAATLHALHYHETKVTDVQLEKMTQQQDYLTDLLTPPLMTKHQEPTRAEILAELQNNVQGLLGYVVRWVDAGIGCSKVPDIHNVGLMEDRATLRISSQHIANWLHHGLISEDEVETALFAMAKVVDKQNEHTSGYELLVNESGETSLAFACAKALIFEGKSQPNGYTEPLLHAYRLKKKG